MKFVENINKEEYTKFVSTHQTKSHFLESYEWGEISKKRGLKPYYVGLKNNENKLVATALLLEKKLPLNYTYFYIPRGFVLDYKNTNLISVFTKKINEFTKKKKSIFFKIDPDIKLHIIDKSAKHIDGENNYELVKFLKKIGYKKRKDTYHFETMQPKFTFRIDLSSSIEEIEKKYSTTTKQRIKKAEKYGIEVFEGNIDDIEIFCDLMKKTEKVKGFYSHDSNFYKDFFEEFSKNNNVTLYIGKADLDKVVDILNKDISQILENIEKLKKDENKNLKKIEDLQKRHDKITKDIEYYNKFNERIIYASAYLTVNYGDKSWALYAGNNPEFKNLFANYLVYKYQIRNSKNMGIKTFDMFGTIGDPDKDSKYLGLHEFKKKFGGDYTEFIGEFDYVQNNILYLIYTKIIPLRHKIINKKLKKKVK